MKQQLQSDIEWQAIPSVIRSLKNNKTPGFGNIPAPGELLKYAGKSVRNVLHSICSKVLESGNDGLWTWRRYRYVSFAQQLVCKLRVCSSNWCRAQTSVTFSDAVMEYDKDASCHHFFSMSF